MNVMDAIMIRRSVRAYRPDPLPEALLASVTEAVRLAPSACNIQPWRFIIVSDPELRKAIARAAREQMFIAEAPVLIVGCAQADKAYSKMGGYWNSADVDVAIAMDHMMLAAAEAGLGTCWIGAFDEAAIKKLLGIPDPVKITAMSPLGYPRDPQALHPVAPEMRRPRKDVFSHDKF